MEMAVIENLIKELFKFELVMGKQQTYYEASIHLEIPASPEDRKRKKRNPERIAAQKATNEYLLAKRTFCPPEDIEK